MASGEAPGRAALLADPLPAEPLETLEGWLAEARAEGTQPHPDAMVLATVDPDGRPSARTVLCRGFDRERGFLVFYTNRESRKGMALSAHPRAALVFHFAALGRQARLDGPVTLSPDAESDRYFDSRPMEARLGAWASRQSEVVASRTALEALFVETVRRFGQEPGSLREDDSLPRPPFWGGYRVWAEEVELWVSRQGRLHDRVLWSRALEPEGAGYRGSAWRSTRLQP